MQDKGLVKTRQFSDAKYIGDPLNAVKIFNEKEVDELLFLDINATTEGEEPDYKLLKQLAVESRMPLCYGGGISSADQAEKIISFGFEKVSVSAAALARPQLISEMAARVGSQSVVVTLDVRKKSLLSGYNIFSHNGTMKHDIPLFDFCELAVNLGAGEIVINSIDRDGMMAGYDLGLAKKIRLGIGSQITLLGGAGSIDDIQELINAVGVVGAGVGSLFVFKGSYRAVLISYDRPMKLY